MPIVEAVGTATTSKKGGGKRVENAMAEAIAETSRESEAIWAREDLSLEEKNKKIEAINNSDALRERIMRAREVVRAEIREEEAKIAAKAKGEAEEKARAETETNLKAAAEKNAAIDAERAKAAKE
jgi:hypothetical protein